MGKLPIRYEIRATGSPSVASELRMMCSTVISEGGYVPMSRRFAYGVTSYVSVGTSSITAIFSIRLKSTYNRITIKPRNINILNNGSGNAVYYLTLNPTLGGTPSWSDVNTYSGAQYDTSATTVSGGTNLFIDYITNKSSHDFNLETDALISFIPLSSNIAGTSDILTISARALAGTQSIVASMQWFEII